MNVQSLDYAGLMSAFRPPLDLALVSAALLTAFEDLYETRHGDCALHLFEQAGASYLFDLASSANLPQEDRTVAAVTLTPQAVDPRDTAYQRGFPMTPGGDYVPVDRGHLIPHLSGGKFGPNLFRQDRALNRGWSEQGKRYRALEREAARTPGTIYFGHLIYADDTAHPCEIELGLLRGDKLQVERFHNRP
jgi:hypothetical protein